MPAVDGSATVRFTSWLLIRSHKPQSMSSFAVGFATDLTVLILTAESEEDEANPLS
jgi:hypothetical protein